MRYFLNRSIHSTTAMACALLTGGLLVTAMAPASADDHIEQRIYQDRTFGQHAEQLRTGLQQKGYQVMNIKADDHNDKPALKVYAKRQGQAFEMLYTYPDLNLIKSEQRPWSQLMKSKPTTITKKGFCKPMLRKMIRIMKFV